MAIKQTHEKPIETNGSGLYGWQKLFYEACRTFGVPSVILLIIVYVLGWVVAPPMIDTMKKFFDSTIETQNVLAETQKAIARSQQDLAESQAQLVIVCKEISQSAASILDSEKATEAFISDVRKDHSNQLDKLTTIEGAVTKGN
jgi:hypothetical protein